LEVGIEELVAPLADLGASVCEVMECGRGGLDANVDRFELGLGDLIFEFGDVAGGGELLDGPLKL